MEVEQYIIARDTKLQSRLVRFHLEFMGVLKIYIFSSYREIQRKRLKTVPLPKVKASAGKRGTTLHVTLFLAVSPKCSSVGVGSPNPLAAAEKMTHSLTDEVKRTHSRFVHLHYIPKKSSRQNNMFSSVGDPSLCNHSCPDTLCRVRVLLGAASPSIFKDPQNRLSTQGFHHCIVFLLFCCFVFFLHFQYYTAQCYFSMYYLQLEYFSLAIDR